MRAARNSKQEQKRYSKKEIENRKQQSEVGHRNRGAASREQQTQGRHRNKGAERREQKGAALHSQRMDRNKKKAPEVRRSTTNNERIL